MKTKYFTPENIDKEAQGLTNSLPGSMPDRKLSFQPERSALLILDMQSYFLDPSSHAFIPSAGAIVPGLIQLAQSYYTHNLPVIFTQHLNSQQDAGSMSRWWKDLITVDNPLSAIIPDFDFSNRYVLRKSQYDAFYQTDLQKILHRKGTSQVVISGVMTHLCCETTARSAFMRGYEVFFLIDGTATYNQEYHLAALLNLSHGFATPMLSSEIQAVLNKQSET
jgi:bifunctional isochorismate lyase/aryl carrier protein